MEHGSAYVQVGTRLVNVVARIYDMIFGYWIFCAADMVVPISYACQSFVSKFTRRELPVIYRGVDIDAQQLELTSVSDIHARYPGKLLVGFV
ncbi:MAG: hypothetical protein H6765_10340 [Candidatus Peribacteria bacterium]|nr:MAG: hypothetical protein H6765_10340 [Candidatus Peribacteria bacterium]